MLKHRVGLVIQKVQLVFVLLQLVVLLEDVVARGHSLHVANLTDSACLLQKFVDLAQHFTLPVFRLDLGVLQFFVVFLEGFVSFFATRLAELFDVAAEGLGNHF